MSETKGFNKAYDALDVEVAELLEDAACRAEANDWKTVQPRDL